MRVNYFTWLVQRNFSVGATPIVDVNFRSGIGVIYRIARNKNINNLDKRKILPLGWRDRGTLILAAPRLFKTHILHGDSLKVTKNYIMIAVQKGPWTIAYIWRILHFRQSERSFLFMWSKDQLNANFNLNSYKLIFLPKYWDRDKNFTSLPIIYIIN